MLYPKSSFARRSGQNPGILARDGSYRNDFERDYARILHGPAFRRLAGKTQLFPSDENDFFRTRLTHSLEVAQISSSVARRINRTVREFKPVNSQISERLCELAALAHDIGHPPFGHNGEKALHGLMNGSGGFEGNAQTLRILSKIEKKELLGNDPQSVISCENKVVKDDRLGLDLCARSLAAILKYDNCIAPERDPSGKVQKGYYRSDQDVVDFIKENLDEPEGGVEFKTIECSIMDIADDIAYSTYDLEDAFKAGFLNPLTMFSADTDFKAGVANTVRDRAKRYYPELKSKWNAFSEADVDAVLQDVFLEVYDPADVSVILQGGEHSALSPPRIAAAIQKEAGIWSGNGYFRTSLTSYLVGRFVEGVKIKKDGDNPIFWKARLKFDDFLCVEVLKSYAYQSLIMSSFLKLAEFRGRDIIKTIYTALIDDGGSFMMPPDYRRYCDVTENTPMKSRMVCDFISGMTDGYAMEFYRRLVGSDAPSIFKPY